MGGRGSSATSANVTIDFNDVEHVQLAYPAIGETDDYLDGKVQRSAGEPLFPELKSMEFLLERKKLYTQASWDSPGARRRSKTGHYLSFSAMLRCSFRWGSVFPAQSLSSALSPALAYASNSATASRCAFT